MSGAAGERVHGDVAEVQPEAPRPPTRAQPSKEAPTSGPGASRRRRIALMVFVLASVAGGALWLTVVRPGVLGFLGVEDDVPSVIAARGEFVRRVVAEGNAEAVEATQLGPPRTSRGSLRIAWLAPDGSRVQEGDVVIRFDPTDMEKELRDGQGDRRAAESRIEQRTVNERATLRNLERDAEMAVMELDHTSRFATKDPDVFSRVEIIQSNIDRELATERKDHADGQRGIRQQMTQIELALLDIQRGKADLQIREAESGLQDLEVEAPHDGTFILRESWGRLPAVGAMVWGGNPLAEIPRLDRMQARVYVLEADAGGLQVGLPATLTLDAHPDRTFEATIKKVDALAMKRNPETPVQYFAVVLELATSDLQRMKPGQRVKATLTLARQPDAIAVPRQAVFQKDGRSVVFVHRGAGSGYEAVEVTLGATGLGRVVVESGIDDGDRIALLNPSVPLGDATASGDTPAAGPTPVAP